MLAIRKYVSSFIANGVILGIVDPRPILCMTTTPGGYSFLQFKIILFVDNIVELHDDLISLRYVVHWHSPGLRATSRQTILMRNYL